MRRQVLKPSVMREVPEAQLVALESFRVCNSGGTPWSDEEVEAALREGW